MIETLHRTPQPVPEVTCERCGTVTETQAYSLLIIRPQVTREWTFCTLECARKWLKPVR